MQIEQLCDFLSTVHLLKSLQPTALKSLAHAMVGQSQAAGSIIYKQGESARHLYVVLTGEIVMYEQDTQHQEQEGSPRGPDSFSRAGRSSIPKASSPRGMRVISSPGGRTKPQSPRVRSLSPSTSKPLSPRRMGSSAGQHAGSTAAGAACSPRSGDSTGAQGPNHSEVRRVRTREAFGEDEVTAHTRREQTAVSIGANKHTFSSSSSSCDGRGPSGGGSSQGSTGGAVPQAAAAAGPQETAAAAAPASTATATTPVTASQQLQAQLPGAAAAAAVADPRSQCVLLVLSAEDYGAALEGRLTGLLEEKVRHCQIMGDVLRSGALQWLMQLAQHADEPTSCVILSGASGSHIPLWR
jgi:CRP-like cAMP-binding protein